jgi:hypothetical protein
VALADNLVNEWYGEVKEEGGSWRLQARLRAPIKPIYIFLHDVEGCRFFGKIF